MKKYFFLLLFLILLFGAQAILLGFTIAQPEANSTATVNKVEGYFVFSYCKPEAKTEYLGTVKVPGIFSDKGSERINKLIKLVKKEFPKAEGIVVSDDFSKADAITFKNEK